MLLPALLCLLVLLLWLYLLMRRRPPPSPPLANPACNLGRLAGVHSIQGQRSHMEDSYYGDFSRGFFGVFDGHGGGRCSHFAASNLANIVLGRLNQQESPIAALTEGFKELDRHWLEMANLNRWDDGSTAVVCLIVDKVLYVANVGDSRAVLCSNGKAIDMSVDHKPSRPDERERVEKLGGRIIHYGTWRVEGILAVTRAVGDRKLKKYVSVVPDIRTRQLVKGDDFLILATDGVWDVLSSQTACNIVCAAMPNDGGYLGGSALSGPAGAIGMAAGVGGNGNGDVRQGAVMLTNAAYQNQSMDNITSLVIDLRAYR